jgi:hypothetical protein
VPDVPFLGWALAIVGGGLLRMAADYVWNLRTKLPPARRATFAAG